MLISCAEVDFSSTLGGVMRGNKGDQMRHFPRAFLCYSSISLLADDYEWTYKCDAAVATTGQTALLLCSAVTAVMFILNMTT